MKLIVGLGNVGKDYKDTRHNVGFDVVNKMAILLCDNEFSEKNKFNCLTCDLTKNSEKVKLVKPAQYMNLSGLSVKKLADYYDIDSKDILVIHDDLDLTVGEMRFKQAGGTGGHHGLQSIHENLGTDEYDRCRIGIGKQGKTVMSADEGAKYVLGRFNQTEADLINEVIDKSVKGVKCWLEEGIEICMNKYN